MSQGAESLITQCCYLVLSIIWQMVAMVINFIKAMLFFIFMVLIFGGANYGIISEDYYDNFARKSGHVGYFHPTAAEYQKYDNIIMNELREFFSFKRIQDVNDVPFVQALVSVAPRHTVNGTNEGYGWWSAVDKEELRRVMDKLNPRHVFIHSLEPFILYQLSFD